jgi:hypothetical protein
MIGRFLLFAGVFLFGALPVVGKGLKSGHTFFILQDLVDGLCLLTSSTALSDVAVDGNSAVESDTNNNGFGRYSSLNYSFVLLLITSLGVVLMRYGMLQVKLDRIRYMREVRMVVSKLILA